MIIAFKDSADGFYQCEVEHEDDVPDWAQGFTRLTEAERLAELAKTQEGVNG